MYDLRSRLGVLGIVVATLFATLFTRLAWLQTVESTEMATNAESLLQRQATLATLRGRILDRNGVVLIDNRLTPTVEIDKKLLPKRQRAEVLTRLAAVLSIPYLTLAARLDGRSGNQLFPVPVAKGIKESAAIYIGEHADLFPGVSLTVRPERVYPQGDVGAHILGYVGRVDDISKLDKNLRYQGNDLIGKNGVEDTYERALRGVPGLERYIVDSRARIRSTVRVAEPIPGQDVSLTIDINVQRSCEESLQQGIEQARQSFDGDHDRNFPAPGGAAVVLDPVDGSVLCMASSPTYSPTDFINRNNAKIEELLKDPAGPLNNRVVQGDYAPGSTFKLVTALAALREGFITANTTYVDEGKYLLSSCAAETAGCVFRNSDETPYGNVDIRRSLTVSSDVFYYWIGEHFWIDKGINHTAIQDVAKALGFGRSTGIALPEEHDGRVPDEASKAKRHNDKSKVFPDGEWRTGDNVNTAIGQGDVLATPLQIATAYAAFLNGGYVLQPRIAFEPGSTAAAPLAPTRPTLAPPVVTAPTAVPAVPATTLASLAQTTIAGPAISALGGSSTGGRGRLGVSVLAQPAEQVTSTTTDPIMAAISRRPLEPVVKSTIPIPEEMRRPIIDGLAGVILQESGTAYDAFVGFPLDRFPIGGKTGTAQVGTKKSDNALFAGFGPIANPRFVVVVVLEEAGFGGQVAAPVARRIFERLVGLPVGPVVRPGEPRND